MRRLTLALLCTCALLLAAGCYSLEADATEAATDLRAMAEEIEAGTLEPIQITHIIESHCRWLDAIAAGGGW